MNSQSNTPPSTDLLQTLILALTDAPDLRVALGDIVRETCVFASWEYGEAWIDGPERERKQHLPYLANWHATSFYLEAFAEQSKTLGMQRAEGMVGRAWSSRAPVWVKSLPDDNGFQRESPATRAGLTAAFAVPLSSEGKVIAVLVFFMSAVRDTDQAVIDTLSQSATLLGALLIRKANRAGADAGLVEQEATNENVRLSQTLLANIVGSAMDAIISIDESQAITLFNRAAEQMFGCSAEVAIGQSLDRFIPNRFQASHNNLMEQFGESDVTRVIRSHTPIVGVRANGEEFPLEASISHTTLGGRKVFTAILRDVTERQRTDEALRAQEAAEEANKAKSEFLSRMSHELRTPLNSIIGFADLLNMEGLDLRQHENLAYIRNAGQHLLQLVNEVLDITSIESGTIGFSLEPVQLAPLVRETHDLLRPLATSRSIKIGFEMSQPDIYAQADRQRLKQVLLNILSNGIKYNVEGGSVTLRIEPDPNDTVRVTVTDTGIGIAPDKIGRLFTPFERLGADRLGAEGTGLGLALTRRLVEAMNGTIGVESSIGKGSIFWIELPSAQAPAVPSLDMPLTTINTGMLTGYSATVLYVEDNLSNIRLVERILEHRQGIRLLSCMQGRLALDIAREHKPDVILLDLHLPDMTGQTVLETLRNDPTTRSIPIIIISADATAGTLERLMLAGANGYLTKPIEVRGFLHLLDDTMGSGVRD